MKRKVHFQGAVRKNPQRLFFYTSCPIDQITPFDSFSFPAYFPSYLDRFSGLIFLDMISQPSSVKELAMSNTDDLWCWKGLLLIAMTFLLLAEGATAQNLGSSPQFNVAVQGQTA